MDEFNNIKGFLSHEEGLFLFRLTKEYCLNGVAVEIGSYCGKSACYIGQACKENNTHLVTIDHHRGSEEQQLGQEYFDPEEFDYKKNRVDTLPTLLKNIRKFNLDNSIRALVSDSVSAAKSLQDDLDIVFIDGSHTFESTRLDMHPGKGK